RDSAQKPPGHNAARGLECIPLSLIGQGWNRDDLSPVETGERDVDHILRRRHDLGGEIVNRQTGEPQNCVAIAPGSTACTRAALTSEFMLSDWPKACTNAFPPP